MDAKQAIAIAKQHLQELFSDELTSAPTLEEVWFDGKKKEWCITLWQRRPTNFVERDLWRDPTGGRARTVPDYKIVRVTDSDGSVQSVKNHDLAKA